MTTQTEAPVAAARAAMMTAVMRRRVSRPKRKRKVGRSVGN